MNFLRILFSVFCWALVLALMLLIAAFIPALQTWGAGWALHHAGVHGSVGEVSAAFGKFEADQVQLDSPDGAFKAAVIQAELPITGALFGRRFHFRSLTAKGWTLTLQPEAGRAGEASDQTAARAMGALLGGWKLPYDFSVDHADLEGDVVILGPKGKDPARVHLKLNGGGLEPGKVGQFAIEATAALADPNLPMFAISADGQLLVSIDTQVISRLELKAQLSPRGSAIPNDLKLEGDLAAIRGPDAVRYTVDLAMAGRHFIALDAHLTESTGLLAGSWKANLKDTDLPLFWKDQTFPVGTASGEGRFEADPNQGRLRVAGEIRAAADHLGNVQPVWERVGAVSVTAAFDATHQAGSLRVARLNLSVEQARSENALRPQATAELLQPVTFDETTGAYQPERPAADWIRGAWQAVPLAWLAGMTGPAAFSGGAVSGRWIGRGAAADLTVRTEGPLQASAVAVTWNGADGPAGLDWVIDGNATHTATGWAMNWNPLVLRDAQGVVAQVTAKVTPPRAEGAPGTAAGQWTAQLPALARHVPVGARRWLAGQTASGDFTLSLGASTLVEAKVNVIGQTAEWHVEARIHAEGSGEGAYNFTIPLTLTFGPGKSSTLEAEGSWSGSESSRLRLKLYSTAIAAENLAPLAAWLGDIRVGDSAGKPPMGDSAGGARPPGALGPTAVGLVPKSRPQLGQTSVPGGHAPPPDALPPDAPPTVLPQASSVDEASPSIPFWGAGTGSIFFQFDQLTYQGATYRDVSASVDYDAKSFQLMDGHIKFGTYTVTDATGGITFNRAVEQPYQLTLKTPLGEVAADAFLPPPKKGDDPLLEGKFTVEVALIGSGRDRAELLSAVRPVFKVSSKGGIIRLLKTDVGAALPQYSTTVGDTVGGVGSKIGSFIGIHGQLGGKNPVSDTAQNILEVTYDLAEIGFDQCSLTAVVQPDGAIDLQDIKLVAPDETFVGSGHITGDAKLPLNRRPLMLNWQVGFRGHVAELMAKGGLLAYKKDQPGYSTIPDLHTTGTYASPVMADWRNLLVQAALKPDPPKKKR